MLLRFGVVTVWSRYMPATVSCTLIIFILVCICMKVCPKLSTTTVTGFGNGCTSVVLLSFRVLCSSCGRSWAGCRRDLGGLVSASSSCWVLELWHTEWKKLHTQVHEANSFFKKERLGSWGSCVCAPCACVCCSWRRTKGGHLQPDRGNADEYSSSRRVALQVSLLSCYFNLCWPFVWNNMTQTIQSRIHLNSHPLNNRWNITTNS